MGSEHQRFVDALRACLGLAPLYAPDKPSDYHQEFHWPSARGVPESAHYGGIPRKEKTNGMVQHIDESVHLARKRKV